jgi:hypothetical protein
VKRLLVIIISLLFLLSGKSVQAFSPIKNVQISAFIGDHSFNLYGYASPKALVNFEGMGIFDQTYADDQGYFQFNNRFSPFSPREACLTAIDQFGRFSVPLCLPPFPTKYNVNIGPVILPPTLSFNHPKNGGFFVGDEVVLSGQTIPNSNVNLSMFTNDIGAAMSLQLIKPAYGFSFPELTAKTDGKGNYSITLPSEQAKKYRLFAQTTLGNSPSPKSNTLNLQIFPWWMWIIRFFALIITILGNRIVEVIIVTEVVIIMIYLLRLYFRPHLIAKNKALTLRDNYPLVEY